MNTLEKEKVEMLIEMSMRSSIDEMAADLRSETEKRYQVLLEQQAKLHGTKEYIQIGYKLAILKGRIKQLNSLRQELEKNSKYEKLKNFVVSNYGEEVLNNFFETL